ncbi:hypothetical protein BJ508DRAFT_325205 [Ascobolus immersus RN42]|uniref:Rhodopsin domain-containing protein n=1 Tax=Ascobolus immersus RN42 TaxID=1160509 RepID=A0A3N4I9I8_ASCIM|nr:hypothetical protein BJ508DRAFT_325205 [Ascobolus immersus RN42]
MSDQWQNLKDALDSGEIVISIRWNATHPLTIEHLKLLTGVLHSSGNATKLLILDWSLLGVSTAFVFFRLWIRLRKLWRLGASDFFILASWCFVLAVCCFNTVLYIFQAKYARPGLPRTTALLLMPTERIMISAKIVFAMNVSYAFLLWTVKASFLALLAPPYRCLPRKYRMIFFGSVGFSVATFIVVLCLNLFWCFPVKRNWTLDPITDYCTPALNETVFVTTFIIHMLTDLNILVLPLFVIQSLGMQSRREYAGIFFVFLIGCLSIAASCARFAVVFESGTFNASSSMSTAQLEIWTPVEQNAAVIAACLPSMRVLIRGAAKSVRATSAKRSDKEYGASGASKESQSSKFSTKLKEHAKRLSSVTGRSDAESEIELGRTWQSRDTVSSRGYQHDNTSSHEQFLHPPSIRHVQQLQHSGSMRHMYTPPDFSKHDSAPYPQHQIIDDYIDPSQIAIAR